MPEVIKDAIANQALASNAEWFSTDVTVSENVAPDYAPIFMLTFALDTSSAVQVTVDSGTTFVNLRDEVGNGTFDADVYYSRPVIVRPGDTFNVRATAAVTVRFARLDEWS